MAQKCYRSELIALFGNPVDENATVVIQEAAFAARGLNYRYITTKVLPEDLETAVKALKALNMKGANVTTPHKVEILQYLDHISETAALMGAVNTIYLKDGETYGENTDGMGFITSVIEAGVELAGKRAVILGAGGAARAMTVELAKAGVKHITIVNRTEARGRALAALLNEKTPAEAEYVPWEGVYAIPQSADIVVNATSVGMYPDPNKPDIDYSTLQSRMVVCDGVHNPRQTPFLIEAAKSGCRTLEGFGMLVNQGAVGFKLWTGLDAPVEVMTQALEREFG